MTQWNRMASVKSRVNGKLEFFPLSAISPEQLFFSPCPIYLWQSYIIGQSIWKKTLSFTCKTQRCKCKAVMPHKRVGMIVATKLNMSLLCDPIWKIYYNFLAMYAESSYQVGNIQISASHRVSSSHFSTRKMSKQTGGNSKRNTPFPSPPFTPTRLQTSDEAGRAATSGAF